MGNSGAKVGWKIVGALLQARLKSKAFRPLSVLPPFLTAAARRARPRHGPIIGAARSNRAAKTRLRARTAEGRAWVGMDKPMRAATVIMRRRKRTAHRARITPPADVHANIGGGFGLRNGKACAQRQQHGGQKMEFVFHGIKEAMAALLSLKARRHAFFVSPNGRARSNGR